VAMRPVQKPVHTLTLTSRTPWRPGPDHPWNRESLLRRGAASAPLQSSSLRSDSFRSADAAPQSQGARASSTSTPGGTSVTQHPTNLTKMSPGVTFLLRH
jgi:hypothetical protein